MIKSFSHYSDASVRKACTLLTDKFGDKGYSFWFRLLEYLNQNNAFPLDVSSEGSLLLLSKYCNPSEPDITLRLHQTEEILNFCAAYKDEEGYSLIDSDMWKNKKIWSEKNSQNVHKNSRKKETTVDTSGTSYKFCDKMFSDITLTYPAYARYSQDKRKRTVASWVPDLDKLLRTYNITHREAYSVWRWLQDSDEKEARFWRGVIKSSSSFYKHFATIDGKMNTKAPVSSKPSIFSGAIIAE